MLYLNDEISVNVPTFTNSEYLMYDIKILLGTSSVELFKGRVYKAYIGKKIYLNDLICSYLKHPWDSSFYNEEFSATSQTVMFGVRVEFQGHPAIDIEEIFNGYREINSIRATPPTISLKNPKIFNIMNMRTKVMPRVPALKLGATHFDFRALLAFSNGFREQSTHLDEEGIKVPVCKIASKLRGQDVLYEAAATGTQEIQSNYQQIRFTGNTSWQLLWPSDLESVGITTALPTATPDPNIKYYTPIALVDDCPAEYYVLWYDRTGGMQCQPFSKRSIMSESIKTNNVINLLDETKPYNKEVKTEWTLNSDWLSQDEYKAFESLFVAPEIYLYDVKNDETTKVICIASKWEEKTNKNTKKPYNLKIDLAIARPDNIIL